MVVWLVGWSVACALAEWFHLIDKCFVFLCATAAGASAAWHRPSLSDIMASASASVSTTIYGGRQKATDSVCYNMPKKWAYSNTWVCRTAARGRCKQKYFKHRNWWENLGSVRYRVGFSCGLPTHAFSTLAIWSRIFHSRSFSPRPLCDTTLPWFWERVTIDYLTSCWTAA